MKIKLIITLILLLFCAKLSFAQADYHTKFNIKDGRDLEQQIEIGFDEQATIGLDTIIGESDLPPFTPPGEDLMVVLLLYEPVYDEILWSYKDFRPFYNSEQPVIFKIKVMNPYNSISFYWDRVPANVDSAYFEDPIEEAEIIKVNMSENHSAFIDLNENYIREFIVKYWVNGQSECTEDFINNGDISIYPNPASDYVNINNNLGERYVICNTLGYEVLSGELHEGNNTLDIRELTPGYYTVSVYTNNVYKSSLKFIKL